MGSLIPVPRPVGSQTAGKLLVSRVPPQDAPGRLGRRPPRTRTFTPVSEGVTPLYPKGCTSGPVLRLRPTSLEVCRLPSVRVPGSETRVVLTPDVDPWGVTPTFDPVPDSSGPEVGEPSRNVG